MPVPSVPVDLDELEELELLVAAEEDDVIRDKLLRCRSCGAICGQS